ncbi:MAG: PQQ-binding-like beta-propeller repeat protein [Planctomycetaceae bacterium]|nr:PQQ-binding-like beta-propeller repeat protein [Planctomycetaceae bacterium]
MKNGNSTVRKLACVFVVFAGTIVLHPEGVLQILADDLTPDCPQWGGTSQRNNAPDTGTLPDSWDVGQFDFRTGEWKNETAENIRWMAKLGNESYASPVIAGGRVFCATNNGAGYVKRYPAEVDLGCLLAFNLADGSFLWQHSAEKLKEGRDVDWPDQGICCSPMVEGDRLWIVTNRGEVVCLDTEGFHDSENDGPCQSEVSQDRSESDVIWIYDMMGELGSRQHNMACCSVTAAGNLLLVGTSNGVAGDEETIPAPEAPSFIALDKTTGNLIWADASPGQNILHGQWGSPACAVLGGVPQAIFPGGDGWLYSFLAERTDDKKARLLWKFDCNPKDTVWEGGGQGDRNSIIATPMISGGLVYITTGEDPESGEGQGDLWCIDPTRRGDVSSHLVVDAQGKPVAPRRYAAWDEAAGEKIVPNENSAAVWHYRGEDVDDDGKFSFEETMHRGLGSAAVRDGLLVIGDFSGLVHCLDAKTGSVYWTHDMLATMWGGPLLADGKIYIGDEDGDVVVFKLAKELEIMNELNVGNSVYSSPVAVGNTLYISTRSHLFAIAEEK